MFRHTTITSNAIVQRQLAGSVEKHAVRFGVHLLPGYTYW